MRDDRRIELISHAGFDIRDRNPKRKPRWVNKIARAREKRIIEAEIADVNLILDDEFDDEIDFRDLQVG